MATVVPAEKASRKSGHLEDVGLGEAWGGGRGGGVRVRGACPLRVYVIYYFMYLFILIMAFV